MNTRHIRTTKAWFGGGADLNPIYPTRATPPPSTPGSRGLRRLRPDAYARFKAWADEYFLHPAPRTRRAASAASSTTISKATIEHAFAFTRAVGEAFLDIYPAARRPPHGPALDDRGARSTSCFAAAATSSSIFSTIAGTQFGLMTGGNPEAILMSLPPAGRLALTRRPTGG